MLGVDKGGRKGPEKKQKNSWVEIRLNVFYVFSWEDDSYTEVDIISL